MPRYTRTLATSSTRLGIVCLRCGFRRVVEVELDPQAHWAYQRQACEKCGHEWNKVEEVAQLEDRSHA